MYSETVHPSLQGSNRQHLSSDDYLEDKAEDYQNCSVLHSVRKPYPTVLRPVGFLTRDSLFVIGLVILCFVRVIWLTFGYKYQHNQLPGKTRL